MAQTSGLSKAAGRVAPLLALVGIAIFMAGLFGAPKNFVFVGVGLIALSLVGYLVEELGTRSWRF